MLANIEFTGSEQEYRCSEDSKVYACRLALKKHLDFEFSHSHGSLSYGSFLRHNANH